MSWVTIVWTMTASACLTLAVMHLLVWCRNRTAWANAAFASTALAMAGVAAGELWMMRAETIGEFGLALRWYHVPGWLLIVSLVGFVRVYLRAGRPWLAWVVCGVRTLSLILDFVFTPNLNYREIIALQHIRFLGESVSLAEGVPNPWMLVGQASLLLLAVFVVDALLVVWRRGDRWRARLLIGSIVFFVVAAVVQIMLALWGIVHTPLTPSLFFLGIVMMMAYDMSFDVHRAAQLSDDLRESEERMTLATEATGVGVWMWSIVRNQVWGSERWRQMFGFAPDATVSFEMVMQRIHPDDRRLVEDGVRRALADRSDYMADYRVVLPDGTQRWFVSRGRVHPNANGKPARMLGTTIDITHRKQAEMEIGQQRNELAHLSRVSTMGVLTSSLAHELNQPLSAILNNAQAGSRFMNAATPDLAEVRGALEDIAQDAKRAGEVIRQMRALVRKDEPHLEPLDLNHVISDVVRLLHSDMLVRKVQIAFELAPGLRPANGDNAQLQQVMLNLLLNAFDSMKDSPEDSRTVIVRTRQQDAAAIRVEVSDGGTGISPDRLVNLFEPFHSSKREGLGLGLSISHSIVEAHKGRLWAENNPDRGATFFFTLPVHEAD